MAKIRAFAAYRPAPGLEDKIAALPYDVYSREEAKRVVTDNPLSFLAIDRAETQFPDSVGTYDDCVYLKAKQMLDDAVNTGKYIQDAAPCYYLYEQTMKGRAQTGIVACASIDDYLAGVIKKHENTRVDKEIDRIRHVDTCNAQTGPIFLCYRNIAVIDDLMRKKKEEPAACDFVSEGNVRNRVWVIDDTASIRTIREAFASTDRIYIADGHHRCASAVKVGLKRRAQDPGYTGEEEFNYFLAVLFPQDQLMVMDYNRAVKDLAGRTPEEFLLALGDIFTVRCEGSTPVRPGHKGEFGLYLADGKWYRLSLKEIPEGNDPVKALDVSILQDRVLNPLLGIQDPKEDPRISFIGGIRGLEELVRRVDSGTEMAAFSMFPTSLDELFEVADAGELMPPKSTWFEPKLLSGLFIHRL
jgi:uncharacterized protein (DUF1015 family)